MTLPVSLSTVKQCDAEKFRSTVYLREIDGDGIEAACAAHEEEMTKKLAIVLEKLRTTSLALLMNDRVEYMVLSRLQEHAASRAAATRPA